MNYGGLVLQGSKWQTDSVMISNNIFKNFRPNFHPTAVGGYVIITDTYSDVKNGISTFKNIDFDENRFCESKNAIAKSNRVETGGFYYLFIAVPGGKTNAIRFKNNYFFKKGGTAYWINTSL